MSHDQNHDDRMFRLRIITKAELRSLVPYTPQHIHRLEKAGRFPRRLQLGPNRVGWRLTDIEAWINERLPAGAGGAQSDPDAFAT
jgi:prophage regulatory protein